jgi:rhodanese-related sulfurtransferase
MIKQLMLLVALVFVGGVAAAGNAVPTPTTLDGGTIVSAEQAYRLFKAGDATFIDTRSALNYGRGHVPAARFVGYKANSKKVVDFDMRLDQFDLTKLPADKGAILVFYSHGDTGWKSYKAAVVSIGAGYRRVHWMREGMAIWKRQDYPIEH